MDLLRDYREKDAKYLFYIFQEVHKSVFPRITSTTKSKQAWDTLQTAYQGMEKVKTSKLQMLRTDFEIHCWKESENVDSFFRHVIGLVTQIRSHGETLEERRITQKVLRSFPSRFNATVISIEYTKDLSQLLVDEIHASLISHEHRLNKETISSLEHVFKTQFSFGQGRRRGRSYVRGRGRSPHKGGIRSPSSLSGRGKNKNPSQGLRKNQAQGQRYDKYQVQFHYYKKYGYYENECREKQYDIRNKPSVNFKKLNKNHDSMILACNVAQEKQSDIWYLDSGCSNHMSGNIKMFSNVVESVKYEVKLGIDSKVSVMGKGKVNILTKKGDKFTYEDLRQHQNITYIILYFNT